MKIIMLKNMKKKGFTLIELLVVIAIIGILASIVLVSLGSTRGKARDAKRESDIRQISLAMEMMYNDNQRYATCTLTGGRLAETAFGVYLDPIPEDPGGGTTDGCNATSGPYLTFANSASTSYYCIWACLEAEGEWFGASQKGTRKLDTVPADLDCW